MLRRTLLTLAASALLGAAGANSVLAFPFGPPPGPPPGLAGPPPGLHGLPPGLAHPPAGLVGPPRAGLGGTPPRAAFGGLAGGGGHPTGLSRLGGGAASARYGQSAHTGYGVHSGYGHAGSRYGRWARDTLYGYGAAGYGYGTDGSSYSSSGCSYVYDGYRRTVVCSDN
jgi:hypothetical protein